MPITPNHPSLIVSPECIEVDEKKEGKKKFCNAISDHLNA